MPVAYIKHGGNLVCEAHPCGSSEDALLAASPLVEMPESTPGLPQLMAYGEYELAHRGTLVLG